MSTGNSLEFDWQIIGHEKIKKFLQKSIVNQTIAHAYLFYGPSKVGKTLTAKTFANSLVCEKYGTYVKSTNLGAVVPCGQCSACQQFQKNIYPDLYIVDREINEKTGKKKSVISVAQIRDLLEKISKRAFLNSFKIVLIPEAQLLNQEASNALLKTLEEPAPRTVIILGSPNKDSLLPTILSRVQMFKFLPVTRQEIYDHLLDKGANREQAKSLSSVALGRPTVAMKFYNNLPSLDDYNQIIEGMLDLLNENSTARFKYIEELVENNKDIDEVIKILNYFSAIARDLLLVANSQENLITNQKFENNYKEIFANYKQSVLLSFLRDIEKAKKLLRQNINPRLLFENLIINI